jgi:hypothetical protein
MSLQFPSRSGYFSSLARRYFVWAVVGLVVACSERDRITFPESSQGDGHGPVTFITDPGTSDTTVVEGDLFFVRGYSADNDGVDTVYFETSGAAQSFSPLLGQGEDTVNFSLEFSSLGHSGGTVTVRIYAVDQFGVSGAAALRQIHIQ